MHLIMKFAGILLVMLSVIATVSCDAVLGPPGSGEDIPFPSQSSAFERTYAHLLEGRPDESAMRIRGGYYIWKEGDRWRIRVSRIEGPPTMYGPGPVFTGTVFVENGFISGVDTSQATGRAFTDIRHTRRDIVFKIEPRQRIEGIDFEVQPAGVKYCITIDLQLNYGSTPSVVHLGRSMTAPETLPLNLCYPY